MYNGLEVEMNKTDTNVPVVGCSFNLFGKKLEKWNELKFIELVHVFRKMSPVCSHQQHCNDVGREEVRKRYKHMTRKTLILIHVLSYQCAPGPTRIYDYAILRGVSLLLEAALVVLREQCHWIRNLELPQWTSLYDLPYTYAFPFFRVKAQRA